MSGKSVVLKFSEKYGWWAAWGNETFYDADRYMLTWETPQAAMGWLAIYHPELIVSVEGDADRVQVSKPTDNQMSLF